MSKRIALIKFKGMHEFMEYSYFTDMESLKEGDVLVVPTNESYSIGFFSRYTTNKQHEKSAKKWIVEKVDIEAYENKLFLGGFEE